MIVARLQHTPHRGIRLQRSLHRHEIVAQRDDRQQKKHYRSQRKQLCSNRLRIRPSMAKPIPDKAARTDNPRKIEDCFHASSDSNPLPEALKDQSVRR